MNSLDLVLPRPCQLKIPPVIRYLDRQYMEEFFRTGRLRLTTYSQCQIHECNIRRDSNEGKANFNVEMETLGTSGWGIQTVGWQSYMLCASLRESRELTRRFNVDAYFRITNVLGFLDAISRRIPGCDSGKIGSCVYKDESAFEKPLSFKEIPPEVDPSISAGGLPLSRVGFEMSDEPYFKKSDKFSAEAEFRFIWGVPYDVEGAITIECPEAIQFCEPDAPVSNSYSKKNSSGDIRSSILMGSSGPQE